MTAPPVVSSGDELASQVASWKAQGETLALVPTMGALHPGHLALVRRAKQVASRVVVSVFVNPLQFGPGEDFDRYPRTLSADVAALAGLGVEAVFAPDVTDVYPDWPHTTPTQSAGPVGDQFEGADRPGHFDGVLTVVSTLFDLVGCDVAVFGRKDAQQAFLVTRMARARTPAVAIVVVDTIRDGDGLALSSRNASLSAAERQIAQEMSRVVAGVSSALTTGTDDAQLTGGVIAATLQSGVAALRRAGGDPHYVDIVAADTFLPWRGGATRECVVIAACTVASVRLLDAVSLVPGPRRRG